MAPKIAVQWRNCVDFRRKTASKWQFARTWMGYSVTKFVLWPAFFAQFDRSSGLQRLLTMDRPRCRNRGCAAHQPDLARQARPVEPANSAGAAGLSRRCTRGAVRDFIQLPAISTRPDKDCADTFAPHRRVSCLDRHPRQPGNREPQAAARHPGHGTPRRQAVSES